MPRETTRVMPLQNARMRTGPSDRTVIRGCPQGSFRNDADSRDRWAGGITFCRGEVGKSIRLLCVQSFFQRLSHCFRSERRLQEAYACRIKQRIGNGGSAGQ